MNMKITKSKYGAFGVFVWTNGGYIEHPKDSIKSLESLYTYKTCTFHLWKYLICINYSYQRVNTKSFSFKF